VCSAILAVTASPAFGAADSADPDPGTTVYNAGGSNLGECSAYLGATLKTRDVNQIIRLYSDQLGIANPGQIYHVRAQQEENEPPAEECPPRNIGN